MSAHEFPDLAVGDTVEVRGRRGKVTALARSYNRIYVQYGSALWGRERPEDVRLVRRTRRKK